MTAFTLALTSALLAAAVNAAGLVVVQRFQIWARRSRRLFLGFAAGVLLAALALHLVPEVMHGGSGALIFVFAGAFGLWLLEQLAARTARALDPGQRASLFSVAAIGLHSFVDGAVYSFTFQHDAVAGTLSASGLVVHEFPEAMVAYMLLRDAALSPRRAFVWAFVCTGLTTPLGMLLSYPLGLEEAALIPLLGLAAGALGLITLAHLLPSLKRDRPAWALFFVGLITVGAFIGTHGH